MGNHDNLQTTFEDIFKLNGYYPLSLSVIKKCLNNSCDENMLNICLQMMVNMGILEIVKNDSNDDVVYKFDKDFDNDVPF